MFRRMFQMDCKRCFQPFKISVIVFSMLLFYMATSWGEMHRQIINHIPRETRYNCIQLLGEILGFDEYKVLITLLLSAIYASSFCSDDNSNYLRLILARVDITTYTQSRFLANTVAIVFTVVVSFFLYMAAIYVYFPVWNITETRTFYYQAVIDISPVLYILMMGLQLGMIVAACSSIGLLFSVYQSNSFVSIGLSGVCLFCAMSYLPLGTPFTVLPLLLMNPACSAFRMFPKWFSYAWGILFPTLVIVLCGYLFYRRMKWRVNNGFI